MSGSNEWAQIAKFRRQAKGSAGVLLGIGDDTAIVQCGPEMLVTVDMLVENVHFDLTQHCAVDVGRKAMNVNISDIAAMAGLPKYAVVAVALPSGRDANLADELYTGLQEAADQCDVSIVGGDTNKAPHSLCISVTLFGQVGPKGAVLRSGANEGDKLFVTGPLGYSLDGKHLNFKPRVQEALALCDLFNVTSMIDISDGLGSDLFHITQESKCGARIFADQIPVRKPDHEFVDGRTPLDHALNDGEDFELLFTVDAQHAEKLLQQQPLGKWDVTVHQVGEITEQTEVLLIEGGKERPLSQGGFSHQW